MIELTLAGLKNLRAKFNRTIFTPEKYLASQSLRPLSNKFGYDRGTPIDRFYIEEFLKNNQTLIKGACLEIADNKYTKLFGGPKVTRSDVLDTIARKSTTILGNLKNAPLVKSGTYDCLIITQTYNLIDDYESAIQESCRMLKRGGVLLATLPTVSPAWNLKANMWRFTVDSAQYVFSKYFGRQVLVSGLGNRQSAIAFWRGFAQEDISSKVLNLHDGTFPLIIGVSCVK